MAKEKKEMSKSMRIVNIVVMTIEILIIIAGIVFSATVIFGSKTKADELAEGYNLTTVLSDSMEGSITTEYEISSFRKIKDLLIVKHIDQIETTSLKVGDVITYVGNVAGYDMLISHRIYKIEEQEIGGIKQLVFYTLGDKERTGIDINDELASAQILQRDVQGKVIKVVPGVGSVLYWFQDPNHFLWSVVIPLAVLLAYNIYLFIRMIVEYRIKKAKEEGQLVVEAIKAQNTINEEEIKRKAIEEYLASQKSSQEIKDEPKEETNKDILEDKKEG